MKKILLYIGIYLVLGVSYTFLLTSCGNSPQEKRTSQYKEDSTEFVDREFVMKKVNELKFKPKFVFRVDKYTTFIITEDTQAVYINNSNMPAGIGFRSTGEVTDDFKIYPLWERSERNLNNQKKEDTIKPTNISTK